jgi:hypothetical protein
MLVPCFVLKFLVKYAYETISNIEVVLVAERSSSGMSDYGMDVDNFNR